MSRDTGVGNERTALAWQRTALGVLAGSAVVARLTFDSLGALALVTLAISVPVGLWAFFEGRGRYQHDAGIRLRPKRRGGRAPLALAFATAVVAVTELAAILAP
jgi:uncharacterized membrane protein YidH (DUF202 family)